VAITTNIQHVKKSQTLPPPAHCAMEITQPTTKDALYTRTPQLTLIKDFNKNSFLNVQYHQTAHQLPIYSQTHFTDPTTKTSQKSIKTYF